MINRIILTIFSIATYALLISSCRQKSMDEQVFKSCDSVYSQYHVNGKMKFTKCFNKGVLDGPYIEYDSLGIVQASGYYENLNYEFFKSYFNHDSSIVVYEIFSVFDNELYRNEVAWFENSSLIKEKSSFLKFSYLQDQIVIKRFPESYNRLEITLHFKDTKLESSSSFSLVNQSPNKLVLEIEKLNQIIDNIEYAVVEAICSEKNHEEKYIYFIDKERLLESREIDLINKLH